MPRRRKHEYINVEKSEKIQMMMMIMGHDHDDAEKGKEEEEKKIVTIKALESRLITLTSVSFDALCQALLWP